MLVHVGILSCAIEAVSALELGDGVPLVHVLGQVGALVAAVDAHEPRVHARVGGLVSRADVALLVVAQMQLEERAVVGGEAAVDGVALVGRLVVHVEHEPHHLGLVLERQKVLPRPALALRREREQLIRLLGDLICQVTHRSISTLLLKTIMGSFHTDYTVAAVCLKVLTKKPAHVKGT